MRLVGKACRHKSVASIQPVWYCELAPHRSVVASLLQSVLCSGNRHSCDAILERDHRVDTACEGQLNWAPNLTTFPIASRHDRTKSTHVKKVFTHPISCLIVLLAVLRFGVFLTNVTSNSG